MKVYLVQRDMECDECSGFDTFAVSSDLVKCKQMCIDDLIECNKHDDRFSIDECRIGDLEKYKDAEIWKLDIYVNINWEVLNKYEIREMEVL